MYRVVSCFSVNCRWGEFDEWSECSERCGGGNKTRSRSQLIPASNGGKECEGKAIEQNICNTSPCEIDCKWGTFGNWTFCTKSCGGGRTLRSRSVETQPLHGGKECQGEQIETKNCNEHPCPGIYFYSYFTHM